MAANVKLLSLAASVSVPGQVTAKKLSHKLFKRLLQKEKRKVKRQLAAEARKQEEIAEQTRLENDSEYRKKIEAVVVEREKKENLQRELNEKLWLKREAIAQEKFRQKQEDEERKKKQKEEQEKAIKLEWERQQTKENEEKEKKEKATKEKEDALFRELQKENTTTSQESFHNPVAPANYGTEKDVVNCSFFLKTGACRFAERCSRHHPRPSSSVTLLIPAMYADIRHIESALDIADRDTGLEFDEQDAYEKYMLFYDDVYPEFQKSGRVVQFKVCCNYEPHLRGNVYVQYTSEEDCQKAFANFNGRWYAGRQLSCEFSPVTNWKSAICGLFDQNRCPRGKNCNFLHVYHNPDEWINQKSGNQRYDLNNEYNRGTRYRSTRPYSSNNWTRTRSDRYRNDDRHLHDDDDDHEYGEKRRKHRRKRSRSLSDEESHRKRTRHRRNKSKDRKRRRVEIDEEKQNSTKIETNSEQYDNKITNNDRYYRKQRSRSVSPESRRTSRRHRKSKRKHRKHKRSRDTDDNQTTSASSDDSD